MHCALQCSIMHSTMTINTPLYCHYLYSPPSIVDVRPNLRLFSNIQRAAVVQIEEAVITTADHRRLCLDELSSAGDHYFAHYSTHYLTAVGQIAFACLTDCSTWSDCDISLSYVSKTHPSIFACTVYPIHYERLSKTCCALKGVPLQYLLEENVCLFRSMNSIFGGTQPRESNSRTHSRFFWEFVS